MKLPTKKQKPKQSLSDFSMLIFGASKIGKTEMCAQIPDALFLATEAGHNHVEAYVQQIKSWEDFLQACAEIAKMNHPFKCIIIDTLPNLYDFCSAYVCEKHKIQHESDLPYGKGHSLVRNEFTRAITKLSMVPVGLIFIAHAKDQDIETRTGKRTRTVPNLPERIRQFILTAVDIIGYCAIELTKDADGKPKLERVIHTKPAPDFDAGDRTGRLKPKLPMDYPAFVKAFEEAITQ